MKRGILTVVSGFSGAGKGTLMKALLNRYDNYAVSVSATTRKPRAGEENGREYFFLTREEFESMIGQNALIEWAQYVGNYYGTPRASVEEQLAAGIDVILEIEMQGGMHVKQLFPDCLMVFVAPPSAAVLRDRLTGRGTETPEQIEKRLARAAEEADYMEQYEYLAVNDDLDVCVEQLHRIIQEPSYREPFRTANRLDFIRELKTELAAFRKKQE